VLTTSGLRDVLETGRQIRLDLCDYGVERPPPLAPRQRCQTAARTGRPLRCFKLRRTCRIAFSLATLIAAASQSAGPDRCRGTRYWKPRTKGEALWSSAMGQQPGRPKPPGNPPIRPEPRQPQPIEEPPRPTPIPPWRDHPPIVADFAS